ncbi:MAG: Grx4 family monothiol glutaredoxin [Polyangiaceae bacterium]|nr:Grx4 family monothiol glutaredoxin [Polyangiaceae bacterium]
MPLSDSLRNQLTEMIASDRVVLFMKGSRGMPQCGFSATVVGILDDLIPTYKTVDVLADPAVRDGIKEHSNWPTIPQLYISGQFVGGCDIVKELHASGELQKLLGVTEAETPSPSITISATAASAIREAGREAGDGEALHLEVSPRFQYGLFFAPRAPGEIKVMAGDIPVLLDRASARRANGISIDFVDGPSGGFKIENPNEPPRVKPLSARELKAMLDKKTPLALFDVRTEAERKIARIEGARLFDHEAVTDIEEMDKGTTLVFHCHHGIRSQAAAERFAAQGFRNVYNLLGGIDAWSQAVDPSVPRY